MWWGSMHKDHTTLQEIQDVTLLLYRMFFFFFFFCLSGKVVFLHLYNSIAKAYLSSGW